MLTKSERTLSLNSCWTMLSVVVSLVITPMAADSPANAANFNLTKIDVPGKVDTVATGINDAGQIVGYFGFTHGFLDTGGNFIQIDVPGASSMAAFGINDAGQIVGIFRKLSLLPTASSIPAAASLKLTCPTQPIRRLTASTTRGRSSVVFLTARVSTASWLSPQPPLSRSPLLCLTVLCVMRRRVI